MRAPDAEAPSNEDVALLTLLLPTLSKLTPSEAELADQLKTMATELLSSRKFGATRRGDAALHLGQLVLGEPHPPELTVARTWPASLTADPLHTLFAILAVSTDEKSLAGNPSRSRPCWPRAQRTGATRACGPRPRGSTRP